MISFKTFCALFGFVSVTSATYDPDNEKFHLPPLDVNPDTVTLVGFSSGSFMANQAFVANSKTYKGVAMLNGGAYGIVKEEKKVESVNDLTGNARIA